jgi:nucleotide-binding universal stress UspA family protein
LTSAVFEQAAAELPLALRESVHQIVGSHDPRQGLIAAAEEWRADMIVVGARGLGPLRQLLVGSVSTSVVRAAHIPVLVARQQRERRADRPLRVLLACDGSESSRQSADWLYQFTWPTGTTGQVIAVIETIFGGELPLWLEEEARKSEADVLAQAWLREHEAHQQSRRKELSALCRDLPPPFSESKPIVVDGNPAEQILKAVNTEAIDLVVLGARRLGTLARWVLGSTSEKVLSHAPCSVLLVRQREAA